MRGDRPHERHRARSLPRAARGGDETALPGFDENLFAANCAAEGRTSGDVAPSSRRCRRRSRAGRSRPRRSGRREARRKRHPVTVRSLVAMTAGTPRTTWRSCGTVTVGWRTRRSSYTPNGPGNRKSPGRFIVANLSPRAAALGTSSLEGTPGPSPRVLEASVSLGVSPEGGSHRRPQVGADHLHPRPSELFSSSRTVIPAGIFAVFAGSMRVSRVSAIAPAPSRAVLEREAPPSRAHGPAR